MLQPRPVVCINGPAAHSELPFLYYGNSSGSGGMVKRGELHLLPTSLRAQRSASPARAAGRPGVGKGTQAEFICSSLAARHLATGDIFRDAKSKAQPNAPPP